jgi:hypothetical protein
VLVVAVEVLEVAQGEVLVVAVEVLEVAQAEEKVVAVVVATKAGLAEVRQTQRRQS